MVKRNETILIVIIISIIIVCFSIILINSNNDTKKVSFEYKQNVINKEEKIINEENNEVVYVEITELEEQNIIKEDIENTQKEETTNNQKQEETPKYYIKVNYGAQVVTIYGKDSEGNYTVPIKAMVCSTGEYTPKSGTYKIPNKWRWLGLEGDVYGQYSTQIVGNILFHSVPYLERGNLASLEYWEYDKLGTYASAGCIRLTVEDAIWIYNNCEIGTKVEFYSSSNPGPLGKPTAKKISNASGELKNWDPTDPDYNNPWRNYKEDDNESVNTQTNEDVTNNIYTNEMQNNEISTNIMVEDNANEQIELNEEYTNTLI